MLRFTLIFFFGAVAQDSELETQVEEEEGRESTSSEGFSGKQEVQVDGRRREIAPEM